MFKKFIKWLIGEDTESRYEVDKEYTYKEDKVNKVHEEVHEEDSKGKREELEELHIEENNVDGMENGVSEENSKDSKVSEIEDNKELEDVNSTEGSVGSEVKKDIKEEVESILKRRSAEGFINKNHLIIDGKRNDYLECECGGIGVVEEGIVTCTRCNKESEVV